MSGRRRPYQEHQRSQLLKPDENDSVFRLLGNKCQSLATAVVQVFLSEPPLHKQWIKQFCGVACFVKDNTKRSYFIKVYDIDKQNQQLWEQEIYTEFKYLTPKSKFHTFEAEKCRTGLNFADEQEANKFQQSIQERLRLRTERDRKRTQSMLMDNNNKNQNNANNNAPTVTGVLANLTSSQNVNSNQDKSNSSNNRHRNKGKDRKRNLTKADIGEPTNFQHVQHVGWDPNTGFDLSNADYDAMDTHLKKLFDTAGITKQQLQDAATRKYIYEVMDKNGFTDIFNQMVQEEDFPDTDTARPPVPVRRNPPTPLASRPAPPVPPVRVPPSIPQVMPAYVRLENASTPPPLPVRGPSAVPTPPSLHKVSTRQHTPPPPPSVPPPSIGGPPPPPPPPMPPPAPFFPEETPEKPSPSLPSLPAVPDTRSALLKDIQKGFELKPVQPTSAAPPPAAANSRDDLLKSIRDGIELRPVSTATEDRPESHQSLYDGMASILVNALAKRAQALQDSDDSDVDDEEEDDDDWDD